MVIDRNHPHTKEWENFFHIIPYLYVVPPDTGKILHNNTVYPAGLYIGDQPLPPFPVKISARHTVVHISVNDLELVPPTIRKLLQKG